MGWGVGGGGSRGGGRGRFMTGPNEIGSPPALESLELTSKVHVSCPSALLVCLQVFFVSSVLLL